MKLLQKLCRFALLGSLGCVGASANTAFTGMRNLTTLQITADMGAGWNLGNALDAISTETSWGNPATTQAMISAIKQRGFKTLRLPVTWKDHLGGAPNYTIDPAWLSRVETVANYAFANDMYVILNTHHDSDWIVPTYANEAAVRDKLVKLWTQIANRFRDYGDYLIFETMNEPRVYGSPEEWTGGNAEHRDVVNRFNLAAVNAIRNTGGNNATRHIMIPTCGNNGSSGPVNALVIPNNDSRIIVTVHNYSPYNFCLNESGTASWSGTAAERSALDAEFDIAYNRFVANGRGVVVGEFGSIHKNNTSARATHAGYVATALKARRITPVIWDNGATTGSGAMGLFNRSTLTWVFPTIADAVVAPFTSGGVIPNGTYRIIARHSGKALDVASTATADGSNVHQWTYYGGNSQRWTVTHLGNNQYSIIGVQSGKALDVSGWGGSNGSNVHIWTYTGGANQKWTITATSGGYYRLTPTHATNMALDVNGSSNADGANVQIWNYGGGNNQQWTFQAP
jgi:endoglucanase